MGCNVAADGGGMEDGDIWLYRARVVNVTTK
jgi:hypothetical protein